jgi:CubicO group peptidase (beta-lactamase class C family)
VAVRAPSRIAAIAAALALARPGAAADLERQIAPIVQRYFPSEGGPGCAVLVARDGEVVYRRACGFADVEKRVPLAPGDVFDLASCSKQFTAAATLRLVESGALGLDDDIRKHLPELAARGGITIRNLLFMTSGLPSYMDDVKAGWEGVTNETVVRLLAADPRAAFAPGARHEYSNTDYNLLATIDARAAGRPFGDLLRAQFFEPLGMTRSAVFETPAQALPGRVFGWRRTRSGGWARDVCDTPGVVGDGSVFSSVDDLLRWSGALFGGKILAPRSMGFLLAPGKLASGRPLDYNCGLVRERREGRLLLWHNGAWAGTSAYTGFYLDEHVAVLVLSNETDLDAAGLGMEIGAALAPAAK